MIRSAFICAAWSWAHRVREMHAALRDAGVTPLSLWAEHANGEADALHDFSHEQLEQFWYGNREGIAAADVVVMLADSPAREAFQEIEYARMIGRQIVWVGRDTLTAAINQWPHMPDEAAAVEWIAKRSRARLIGKVAS